MSRCSIAIHDQIEEADALNRAGECWCPCVNDDVPHARELVEAGKCAAASSVIRAALRRCNRGGTAGRIEAVPFEPVKFEPIVPWKAEE